MIIGESTTSLLCQRMMKGLNLRYEFKLFEFGTGYIHTDFVSMPIYIHPPEMLCGLVGFRGSDIYDYVFTVGEKFEVEKYEFDLFEFKIGFES